MVVVLIRYEEVCCLTGMVQVWQTDSADVRYFSLRSFTVIIVRKTLVTATKYEVGLSRCVLWADEWPLHVLMVWSITTLRQHDAQVVGMPILTRNFSNETLSSGLVKPSGKLSDDATWCRFLVFLSVQSWFSGSGLLWAWHAKYRC